MEPISNDLHIYATVSVPEMHLKPNSCMILILFLNQLCSMEFTYGLYDALQFVTCNYCTFARKKLLNIEENPS